MGEFCDLWGDPNDNKPSFAASAGKRLIPRKDNNRVRVRRSDLVPSNSDSTLLAA